MEIISFYYYILAGVMFLGSFVPLVIYLLYGREPKIDDAPNYVMDLPTDDPPAIVNAICSGFSKKVGEPDMNGFIATIMDLIGRNYLFLVNNDSENEDSDVLFLEINLDHDPDSLWDFERTVINFLSEYQQDGIISMDQISESFS